MPARYLILAHYAILLLFTALYGLPAYAQTPGKDGDRVINNIVIVNEYAALSANASAGNDSVTVVSLATSLPSLERGDLVMIYQAQGASITGVNSASYGTISSLRSAGRYEYQTVASISGNTIFFESFGDRCTGLTFRYTTAGNTQVIRVPQFNNLTITGLGSIVAQPWNGSSGGVVAISVAQSFTNNGSVSAKGAGFRGGATDNLSGAPTSLVTTYRSTNPEDGGEKGESIAGFQNDYPNGRYARGAPANGGGGGVSHNSGGGGGANGNNGNRWAGQGVPDTSVANWVTAWNLDTTLNPNTRNAGGGRGGYSFIFDTNPLTQGPGTVARQNRRREVGGLGGRPLDFDGTGRLYFGGGGGAGDGNNGAAGAGGRGGGLVFIMTQTANGSGLVVANGNDGEDTSPNHNDAPGGGGGGGTIVIQTNIGGGWRIEADGGDGGNQLITGNESEGPGGGGGGGVIAVSGSTSVRFARGGANGETSASSMADFRPNGATRGNDGQPNLSAPSEAETPFCRAPEPEPLIVTKTSNAASTAGTERFALPGNDRIYTITVVNPSFAIDEGSIIITDILPQEIIIFTGDFGTPGSGPVEFLDGVGAESSGLTCCTTAQITYSIAETGNDFSHPPNSDFDPLVRRIRITPSGAMAEGLATPTQFLIRFRSQIR